MADPEYSPQRARGGGDPDLRRLRQRGTAGRQVLSQLWTGGRHRRTATEEAPVDDGGTRSKTPQRTTGWGMTGRRPDAAAASETAAELVRFVRATLGCGCPDDVLARIAIDVSEGGEPGLDVGGRLLVRVLSGDDMID